MYRPWPGLIPSARGRQLCSKYPRTYAFHGPYLWLIQHRGLHEHGQMTLYKRRGDIPLVEVGTFVLDDRVYAGEEAYIPS